MLSILIILYIGQLNFIFLQVMWPQLIYLAVNMAINYKPL